MDLGINNTGLSEQSATDRTTISSNHALMTMSNDRAITGTDETTDPEASASADVNAVTTATAAAATGAGAGPSTEASKPRMKRMTLNDAQKYEICVFMRDEEERSGRLTNKSVAAYILSRYDIKVDESTVSRLKSQAESRLSRDLANPMAKRHRQVVFPELERLLAEFIQTNKRKIVITDSMLINRGKELRDLLNIPETQMKFSDGWLNKFKVRHGLKAASVQKSMRIIPVTPNTNNALSSKRAGASSSGSNTINAPQERSRQPAGVVAISLDDHNTVETTLPTHSLNPSSTSMNHDEHPVDVDMQLATSMDVDQAESSREMMTMEEVLGQHEASRAADTNTRNTVESGVHASGADFPEIQMEVLASVYGNPSSSGSTATGAGSQPGHQRQRTASRLRNNQKGSSSIATTTAALSSMTVTTLPASAQLNTILPLTATTPVMGTAALTDLGLSTPTSAAVVTAAAASTNATGAVSEPVNSASSNLTRPTPLVTPARASLTMRLADPIAAAFQPEPIVDFAEAAQCVNTLRIFMQQQNFSSDQLEQLKQIYLTLDGKRKQQQQES